MDTHELAWVAGFVDGEGHFGNHSKGSISFELCQSVPAEGLLQRMMDAVGMGVVQGPYQRSERHKPMYKFRINKYESVKSFYQMIQPWLGETKRKQAESAIARFESTYGTRDRKKNVSEVCRKGHSYLDSNNVYMVGSERRCKACHNASQRRYYASRNVHR